VVRRETPNMGKKAESAEMKFLRSVAGFTPPYISRNANQLNILFKLDPEDGGSIYIRNVGRTARRKRILIINSEPQQKHEISN
jgi:hypothetical protein